MVSIRPGTPPDARSIALIQVQTWRRAYAGIVPVRYLAALSRREKAEGWRDLLARRGSGEFVLVAEAKGRPVGFVAGGPEREAASPIRGEIYDLYILPRMQFRGVGRALFLAAVDCLLMLGFRSIIAWTLASSPYHRFFESLEGEAAESRSIRLGGRRLEEVGYQWADIRPLVPEFVLPVG